MLQTNDVTMRIHDWIVGHFPLARSRGLGTGESLLSSGIVDSLGTLDIVMFLEEEFALTVEDEEMVADHFESVEAIASFVASKIGR